MTGRTPYPRTPAYGEGVRRRGSVPASTTPGTPEEPRGVGPSLVLAVVVNLVTLGGVVVGAWPAGDVFLLFWYENVVLGLVTLVRVLTSSSPGGERVTTALFFCVHYGIFCAVHLVFTLLVASMIGVRTSWLFVALPVVLLLVRYGAELATTWFGDQGLRRRTPARVAMFQPYPRIVVLHLAVLLTFVGGLAGTVGGVGATGLDRWRGLVPSGLDAGVLAVGVLVVVKTVVDVLTTRRALRAR